VVLTSIELSGEDGATKTLFDYGERMTLRIRYQAREEVKSPTFMVAVVRSDGVGCNVYASEIDGFDAGVLADEGGLELKLPPLKLTAERYVVHVLIRKHGSHALLCAQVGRAFHVRHPQLDATNFGVFHEPAQWRRP
jgi:lipopolysaccharide transport system ATP-binding protein